MIPPRRAALYARYSSDLQSPHSIGDQLRICREKAAAIGAEIVGEYTDAAISGSALLNRPGILQLLADARAGAFDLVIAEAQDRLSRDLEDVAGLFKRLSHQGIAILTLEEGDISELHIGLKGTMNALFLKALAAKVRRGQRGRVEQGRAGGGGIGYGYCIVRRLRPDGEPDRGLRAIDETQAAIVRRIFAETATGKSPRSIAGDLNAEGVPSPRGGPWNASTISGNAQRRNGILHNELYLGRLIYNRQSFRKDPDTGRRVPRINPRAQWITHDVPELRIIDDATWEAAQAARRRYAGLPLSQTRRPKHLFSGLLRCGLCGGPFVVVAAGYLGCSHKKERRTCSNGRRVALGKLETAILDGIRRHLLAPDLVAAYVKERQALILEQRRTAGRRELEAARQLDRLAQQIRRAVDSIMDGTDTPALRKRLREAEAEKEKIEAELASTAAAQEAAPLALHPGLAEQYRARIDRLQQALSNPEHRAEAVAILRDLIEGIAVHPGARRGEMEFELTARPGALEPHNLGALAIVNETRVKVVAPARFAQYRPAFTVRFRLV